MRTIWSVANLLRDSLTPGGVQDVILPLTVLRRFDCVLAPTKQVVLAAYAEYADKLNDLDRLLRARSGCAFYNTSRYDFETLVADAPHIGANFRNYIYGFSPNVREVIDRFELYRTLNKLDEAGLLFKVLERFKNLDLHPDNIPQHVMRKIFGDLLRKLSESQSGSTGDHFAPREVVHLLVNLVLANDHERLRKPGAVVTVSDPCCGTGGLLTMTKDYILGSDEQLGINPEAQVHLFGQEVNSEAVALCKSLLFINEPSSKDADRIVHGSTFERDGHPGWHFDYQIANPPFGCDWKRDREAVEAEAFRGPAGRFPAGTPRVSDGQLLFLQHILTHMKAPEKGGSRAAIVMSGSPLFSGDAGSGESEIRRWVLENDWLEALIELPAQLFYTTAITTYVWVLSNRKPAERKGLVLLMDASDLWQPLQKSLGEEQQQALLGLVEQFEVTGRSKIFPTTHFGSRKIRVERPLRLNFQASAERIARLERSAAFNTLKKGSTAGKEFENSEVPASRELQSAITKMLHGMADTLYLDRQAFRQTLKQATRTAGLKLRAPLMREIESALSARDETAEICVDDKGNPEADPRLREYYHVPLNRPVQEFFEAELKEHRPTAWIDPEYTDRRDGKLGRVGYEIDFRIFPQEYFRRRAKRSNLLEYPAREVLEEVMAVKQPFMPSNRSIYVPRTARGRVHTSTSALKNYQKYLELRIRAGVPLTPKFLAAYLNNSEGKRFRQSIARGATVAFIRQDDWASATFFLPPPQIQQEIEEILRDIRNLEVGLESLKSQVWKGTTDVKKFRSKLREFNPLSGFKEWVGLLPFPLASALWLVHTEPEPFRKLFHLKRFFEATAEFHATVLLSGLKNDPEIFASEQETLRQLLNRTPIERATFGTWVNITGRLASRIRQLIGDSTQGARDRVLGAFGIQTNELLNILTSSVISGLLQKANAQRNEIDHGGAPEEGEIRDDYNLLSNLVSDYQSTIADLWERWPLVIPGLSKFDGAVHTCECEVAMGTNMPFERTEIQLQNPPVTGAPYLYDSTAKSALKLLPFVILSKPTSDSSSYHCYFYSRMEGPKTKFVSYQAATRSKKLVDAPATREIVDWLSAGTEKV